MAVGRISDPVLLERLRASVTGMDWAASLVRPWQHEVVDELWAAHHQLAHLLAVETENFQVRIRRMLAEDSPVLERWDGDAFNASYVAQGEIMPLAERFMAERTTTVGLFTGLTPEQWQRTGTWPDGTVVDLAWLAEKALWHSMDHFAQLLDLHGEFAPRQAGRLG